MRHELLSDVHHQHAFRLRDGSELKNLYELAENLGNMSQEEYQHHVNPDGNDFHNWVLHIVKDEELAKVLSEVRTRKDMAEMVKIRIAGLESFQTVAPKKITRVKDEGHPLHHHRYSKDMVKEHAILSWGKDKDVKYAMLEFTIGFIVGITGAMMLVRALV